MGVMTMKMISSTSMTSTIGVTLMLALTFDPSFLTAIAIGLRSDRKFSGGGDNQGPGGPEGTPGSKGFALCLHFSPAAPVGARKAAGRLPAVALLDEVVDQLAGGVIHLDVESLHEVG